MCSDGRGRDERGTGYKVYPARAAAVNLAPTGTSMPAGFNACRFVRCARELEAGGLFVILGVAGINAFPVERLKHILVEEFGLAKQA